MDEEKDFDIYGLHFEVRSIADLVSLFQKHKPEVLLWDEVYSKPADINRINQLAQGLL